MNEALDRFSQSELLGRPLPPMELKGAEELIAGRRVAVTGAAGSVGGPLARMLAELRPAEMLLIDHHEHTFFRLRQELGPQLGVPVRWALADIRDRRKMEAVFKAARPDVVFHLAAYKHVPLGEENPDQTVEVNLAGTRVLIETAATYGACRFVYPSSDKAVHPPSIYGSTKRIAETMALAADGYFPMDLSVVRFVNIVGTRGSVIETLSAQIAAGKPLTLTDPGMTRYWITMPEATRLLVQAAAAPGSGEVFMPDPGPAINLSEMAQHLFRLLAPEGQECRITFIGPRPGERMHEILLSNTEKSLLTPYPGILQVTSARASRPDYPEMCLRVDSLLELAFRGEPGELRTQLLEMAESLQ